MQLRIALSSEARFIVSWIISLGVCKKKELRIRTEDYETKKTKIYIDKTTQEEGETSVAMMEYIDGDNIIDKYDKKILRDLGNSIMKIKL